jgi:hypothetical protein
MQLSKSLKALKMRAFSGLEEKRSVNQSTAFERYSEAGYACS